MCDYSLEMYRSRPARAGERYETHRFASGTVGFVDPQDKETAVCVMCDTRLTLSELPPQLQHTLGVSECADATFVRIEPGPHHDGVRFANGKEIALQHLGPGVAATIIDDLVRPWPATAPAEAVKETV